MPDFSTVGIPSTVRAGDIVVVLTATQAAVSVFPPSFAQSLNLAANNLFMNGYLFSGTAEGAYPFELAAPAKGTYATLAFQDFTAVAINMNGVVSNNTANIVAPTINARGIGDWLICAWACDSGAVLAVPAGMTELCRIETDAYSILVAYKIVATRGQTGNQIAVADKTCNGAGMQMTITPSTAPPPADALVTVGMNAFTAGGIA